MTVHGTWLVIALTEGFANTLTARVKSQKDLRQTHEYIIKYCKKKISLSTSNSSITNNRLHSKKPNQNTKPVSNFAFVLGGIGLT